MAVNAQHNESLTQKIVFPAFPAFHASKTLLKFVSLSSPVKICQECQK